MNYSSKSTRSISTATTVKSNKCTCCKCGDQISERSASKFCYQTPDMCIVEGSDAEKMHSLESHSLSASVWSKVKPPGNFSMQQPLVTARRTEIVRAQLNRKAKEAKDEQSLQKKVSKTSTRARRSRSRITRSKVSFTKF